MLELVLDRTHEKFGAFFIVPLKESIRLTKDLPYQDFSQQVMPGQSEYNCFSSSCRISDF